MTARSHWFASMLDSLPSFITTLTPFAVLALNAGLAQAGEAHVAVGGQTELLAAALLVGNALRRGFESGQFARLASNADAEYAHYAQAKTPAVPVPISDVAPAVPEVYREFLENLALRRAAGDPSVRLPPGAPVPADARIVQDEDGSFFVRQGDTYVKVAVHHVS